MTAGDVQVQLTAGSVPVSLLVQPGMTHAVRLPALIGGEQRMVDVLVSVIGQPCPDPADHARPCAENDHDQHGDCDGTVRQYTARRNIGGVAAGEPVEFCSHHAQIHGRHIRKA